MTPSNPQPDPKHLPGHAAKQFFVADILPTGDVRSCEPYTYSLLEQIPGATDLIAVLASNLYRTPDSFEVELGAPHELVLRCSSIAPTSAIATLRRRSDRATVSLSLLVTGQDPTADRITIETLQKHLIKELRNTPHEPSFDLLSLPNRPLVATINLADPQTPTSRRLAALTDRCLAAAFFRYHHLA